MKNEIPNFAYKVLDGALSLINKKLTKTTFENLRTVYVYNSTLIWRQPIYNKNSFKVIVQPEKRGMESFSIYGEIRRHFILMWCYQKLRN
jgi:hypothetical protein